MAAARGLGDALPDPGRGPVADVVLEGGGVKGIGLVGALASLGGTYSFARVAGTSAGAVVGSVLAALTQAGEPLSRLDDLARTLDYRRFRDRGVLGRHLGPLGVLADALSVLVHDGAYRGDYLRRWLRGVLGDLGVHTFADLRVEDPGGDGSIRHRYRLVVVASDVSRRRLVQLPWDFADYGLDPDEQDVVEAVRASASIPYFFEPVSLRGARGTSTLVDGALLSNYPISIFDRTDGRAARWPTLGVRLSAASPPAPGPVSPLRDPVSLGVALVETAIEGSQAEHLLAPCTRRRTVYVDPGTVGPTDFSLSAADQRMLLDHGREAGAAFLETWDYPAWLRECRGPRRSA